MTGNSITYTVKRIDRYGHFEIAKWDEGNVEPSDVYDVSRVEDKQPWCNCFGFRRMRGNKRDHKHVKLVDRFLRDGEPMGMVYRLDEFNEPQQVGSILSD